MLIGCQCDRQNGQSHAKNEVKKENEMAVSVLKSAVEKLTVLAENVEFGN